MTTRTTCCCALHLCWWCITRTPRYHGCSNSSTVDRSMSMETSQRHFTIVSGAFWEMFLIRTRDDRGSEDRSGTIDNSCSEVVERCRYVTGGMKFDLMALRSTTDISFVYNTPTPFVTLHSSSSSNFQMNFARSRPSRYRWYDLLLCAAPLLMVYNVTPWYHGWSYSTSLDHSTSMETSQRQFTTVSEHFHYLPILHLLLQ